MSLGSCNMKDCFAAVGAVVVCYIALRAVYIGLRFLRTYVLSGALGLHTDLRRTGQWAVVTGSTDGIGKAYAEQLAEKGLNIVLISRTKSKLQTVAAEIEAAHQVKTKIITADFTRGAPIYDGIRTGLLGLDIGVLVNNVGMAQDEPNLFLDAPNRDQLIMDMVLVNCAAMPMMCSIVMPGMVSRNRGVVINVSSGTCVAPGTESSLYAATKAYIKFLSECLDKEYRSKGIVIQCAVPHFVATKMSKRSASGVSIPTPTAYVRSALATVGLESVTRGYWSHAVEFAIFLIVLKLPDALQKMVEYQYMKGWKQEIKERQTKVENKKKE